jgi:hypothetical protein
MVLVQRSDVFHFAPCERQNLAVFTSSAKDSFASSMWSVPPPRAGRGKGKGADLQRAKFYLKHRGKENTEGGRGRD